MDSVTWGTCNAPEPTSLEHMVKVYVFRPSAGMAPDIRLYYDPIDQVMYRAITLGSQTNWYTSDQIK